MKSRNVPAAVRELSGSPEAFLQPCDKLSGYFGTFLQTCRKLSGDFEMFVQIKYRFLSLQE
jgi:hypothetical protein